MQFGRIEYIKLIGLAPGELNEPQSPKLWMLMFHRDLNGYLSNYLKHGSVIVAAFMLVAACCSAAKAQYGSYSEPAPNNTYDTSFNSSGGTGGVQANQTNRIGQWFSQYDQIRRQAQMSPQERQQADYFLSKITAVFVPGQEKLEAKDLLTRMVSRYRQASVTIKQLPLIPETEQLQRGYYKYFVTAGNLFIDYLKVQNNLLATDPQTGQPLAAQLMQRKQALEELNQSIQGLDQQTRNRYGIPPYRYQ